MRPLLSPFTALLTWLAVSVFLLGGAPLQAQSCKSSVLEPCVAASCEAVGALVTADRSPFQKNDRLPLSRSKEPFDLGTAYLDLIKLRIAEAHGRILRATTVQVFRPSLVGMVELRL